MRFLDKKAVTKLDGITAEMKESKGIVKTFYYWTTTNEIAKGDNLIQQGIDTLQKISLTIAAHLPLLRVIYLLISTALETEPFCSFIQNDLGVDDPVQMIL